MKYLILAATLLLPFTAKAFEPVIEPTHYLICKWTQHGDLKRPVYKYLISNAGVFAVRTVPIEEESLNDDYDTVVGVTGCRIERIEDDK